MDTSVLLNFGEIKRFNQLLRFMSYPYITLEVEEEAASFPTTSQALRACLRKGRIRRYCLTPAEIDTMLELRGTLGAGEASTIVAASRNGWSVAVDDRTAHAAACSQLGKTRVIDTNGILTLGIEKQIWTLGEAQALNQAMRLRGRKLPPLF